MSEGKPNICFSGPSSGSDFFRKLTAALGQERFAISYAFGPPQQLEHFLQDTNLFVGFYDSGFHSRFRREYEVAVSMRLPVLVVIFEAAVNPELSEFIVSTLLKRGSDDSHKVIAVLGEDESVKVVASEIREFFDNGSRFVVSGEVESGVTGVTREFLESEGGRSGPVGAEVGSDGNVPGAGRQESPAPAPLTSEELDARLDEAGRLLAAGKEAEAERLLSKLGRAMQGDPALNYRAAERLKEGGHLKQARAFYEFVAGIYPDDEKAAALLKEFNAQHPRRSDPDHAQVGDYASAQDVELAAEVEPTVEAEPMVEAEPADAGRAEAVPVKKAAKKSAKRPARKESARQQAGAGETQWVRDSIIRPPLPDFTTRGAVEERMLEAAKLAAGGKEDEAKTLVNLFLYHAPNEWVGPGVEALLRNGYPEGARLAYERLRKIYPPDEYPELIRRIEDQVRAGGGEPAASREGGGGEARGPSEDTATAETGAAAGLSFSEEGVRVLRLAMTVSDRVGLRSIDRTVLLASLFMSGEEPAADLFLSTFGVAPADLVAPLWQWYGYPRLQWDGKWPLLLDAETLEGLKDETARRADEAIRFGPQDELGAERVSSALARANELARAQGANTLGPRQLLEALMEGQTAWLAGTFGEKETASVRKVLEERRGQEITLEDVLNRAAKEGVRFKNPAAQSDSASVVDLLGFDEHAEALADIIRKPETRPPLVVGVYGPWGSGKSTFMGRVKWMLEGGPEKERAERERKQREEGEGPKRFKRTRAWGRRRRAGLRRAGAEMAGVWAGLKNYALGRETPPRPTPKIVTVEYDAWAYSDTPKLWSGLVGKVAKELDAELGWWGRLKYLWEKHSRRLFLALLLGFGPVALFLLVSAGDYLHGLFAARQFAEWPPFLRAAGARLTEGAASDAARWTGALVSLAGLVSTAVLQRRPVTDAVTALAARFDSAHALGVVSSIQDEFKTALQTRIAPDEEDAAERRKSTLRQRIERNELKIVVFIDELDRCPLERIVDILEAIKLFLAEDLFIVFLGVDTRVAAEAIRLHYKEVRNPDLPREYLEKIVQLPLRVPTGRPDSIRKFLENFMSVPKEEGGKGEAATGAVAGGAVREQQPAPGARQALTATASQASPGASGETPPGADDRVRPGDQFSSPEIARAVEADPRGRGSAASHTSVREMRATIGARAAVAAGTGTISVSQPEPPPPPPPPRALSSLLSLPDTEAEFEFMAELAAKFLESNPRRIKRLLNTYRYVKILSSVARRPVADDEWQKQMLAWLAFTMKWPVFMERAIGAAQQQQQAASASAPTASAAPAKTNDTTPKGGAHDGANPSATRGGANGGAKADTNGGGAGAAGEAAAGAGATQGAAKEPEPFLLGILAGEADDAGETPPTAEQIKTYLPIDAAQIVELYELAGNFLVENPRPHPAAREERPDAAAAERNGARRAD